MGVHPLKRVRRYWKKPDAFELTFEHRPIQPRINPKEVAKKILEHEREREKREGRPKRIIGVSFPIKWSELGLEELCEDDE